MHDLSDINLFFIVVAVTPPAIKEVKYLRQNIGCNLVEWTPIDTGSCHVTYSIQYESQKGIVGIITNIDDATNVWCTHLYNNATGIKMWAVYNSNIGPKSGLIPLTDNPCNSVKLSGKCVFCLFFCFCFRIFIYIFDSPYPKDEPTIK